jgi:hypothetical protein
MAPMTGVPPRPVDLAALIRAHPFITIEYPPELWQPDVDDVRFIPFFGEVIVASLVRNGQVLADVTINVSNVVIEPSAAGPMPAGEFIGITAYGPGNWGGDVARHPVHGARPPLVSADLEAAAAAAGARWAYTRDLGQNTGSVTVLFARRT